ncbi:cysteine desulfurase family protein [Xanthomonas arboricola]|uniref:cysteine desulfurase family protein n=1 Tax=Xanthomonas arboricola TaxID=56448 RepID=UPI001427AA00|nr:cysteine desulfurase family protein [Xanthomonas arboricola]
MRETDRGRCSAESQSHARQDVKNELTGKFIYAPMAGLTAFIATVYANCGKVSRTKFVSSLSFARPAMKPPIYLDCNASTQPDPKVVEAMLPWLGAAHANPHAGHLAGQRAAKAVDTALQAIASLIGASPSELIITSGATESNNLALQGILSRSPNGSRLLHSSIEHKAVIEVGAHLRTRGVSVETIPVDKHGRVEVETAAKMIDSGHFDLNLASIMHANNEIGTIQPIEEVSNLLRSKNGILHVDAAQTAGRLRIDVAAMGVDLLSLSSHKMYGPSGIGALYISPRVRKLIQPLFFGGGQQSSIRPGTLPIFLISGFGKACEIISNGMERDALHTEVLADAFCNFLSEFGANFKTFDCGGPNLPGLRSIRFIGADADDLVMRASPKLSISSGSACTSGSTHRSHVLQASGFSDDEAREVVRIGFGRQSTMSEAYEAARILADAAGCMSRLG